MDSWRGTKSRLVDSWEGAGNPDLWTAGVQNEVLISDKQKRQEVGHSEILPLYNVGLSIYFRSVIEAEQHFSVIGYGYILNCCQPKVLIEIRQQVIP